MIAYGFKDEFEPDLKSGAKPLTLRRDRTHPARHANVGEPIGLWLAMRTKRARRAGVGLVCVRGLLRYEEAGLVEFSSVAVLHPHDVTVQAILAPIEAREPDAFARLDGFESWAALWAWHQSQRKASERTDRFILRELIGWKKLSDEAAAQLDSGAALEDLAA